MEKDRIAGSAKNFAGKVEGAVGDIAGDAKTEAAGRVREATSTAQNLYGQAKDAAREATDAAVNYAKDAYENSGDTFRDGSQAIAKKVQDNPLGSMLIAGGIGFALALLLTRPPRRPAAARAITATVDPIKWTRSRACLGSRLAVPFAGRDHRQPFWPTPG